VVVIVNLNTKSPTPQAHRAAVLAERRLVQYESTMWFVNATRGSCRWLFNAKSPTPQAHQIGSLGRASHLSKRHSTLTKELLTLEVSHKDSTLIMNLDARISAMLILTCPQKLATRFAHYYELRRKDRCNANLHILHSEVSYKDFTLIMNLDARIAAVQC
jgi:hypothetical protein